MEKLPDDIVMITLRICRSDRDKIKTLLKERRQSVQDFCLSLIMNKIHEKIDEDERK